MQINQVNTYLITYICRNKQTIIQTKNKQHEKNAKIKNEGIRKKVKKKRYNSLQVQSRVSKHL